MANQENQHPCQQLKTLYKELSEADADLKGLMSGGLLETDRKEFIRQGVAIMQRAEVIGEIKKIFGDYFKPEIVLKRKIEAIGRELGSDLQFVISGDMVNPFFPRTEGGVLTNEYLEELSRFITHPRSPIQRLQLKDRRMSTRGLDILAEALKNPANRVETLSLDENALTDKNVDVLIGILTHPDNKLRDLSLEKNWINTRAAGALLRSLKDPSNKLITLDLAHNSINFEIGEIMNEVLTDPAIRLKDLYISANMLDAAAKRKIMSQNQILNPNLNIYL